MSKHQNKYYKNLVTTSSEGVDSHKIKAVFYLLSFIIVLFLCITTDDAYSQNPQWIVYTTQNSGLPVNHITALAYENNEVMWIGTGWGGLVKFDWTKWKVYDTSNSPLPHNVAWSLDIDNYGTKWIGTAGGGAAKFDGFNWTVYNTSNSQIPNNIVLSLEIDRNNIKWMGAGGCLAKYNDTNWIIYSTTNSGIPYNAGWCLVIEDHIKWIGSTNGVGKFNDTNWVVYTYLNSGLPSNYIEDIFIDRTNNKWIATRFGGLAKFNSIINTWTVYNTSNSGIPEDNLNCVAVDTNNVKYIGSYGSGLVIFNDTLWTIYNTSNSPIPSNSISCITIDSNNNKWLGTGGGLAIYNENGIVSIENNYIQVSKDFVLHQNFPNPFNPHTTIKYILRTSGNVVLNVYNALGKKIKTLVDKKQNFGTYLIEFKGTDLPSGVYFYLLKIERFLESRKMIILK